MYIDDHTLHRVFLYFFSPEWSGRKDILHLSHHEPSYVEHEKGGEGEEGRGREREGGHKAKLHYLHV